MKKIVMLFIYYITGMIVFNLIYSITEIIIASVLSLQLNFFYIIVRNTFDNLILYTVIYFIVIGLVYCIDIYLVKKLNQKLQEKRWKNEE